ncbi:ribosomal RNA processing protein 36 homolog isoform X2 [Cryptotermes secundus]|nr:ribosomal RNA processing protein 36 homolog isoform X2 [Cryptotermes secundus]XP_023711626.1 ribosomal RNA processing protein 36 homolog isoform X2 [Cryptotermes secundus]XP_023711633.1 ribosomal RNA processing protein 36 homolog isoform X2 [Cryptotermes secundus]
MSFEELQKLKEQLGSKVYNEAMFGTSQMKKTDFKRENKNRPREMSSKQVCIENLAVSSRKTAPRDPRFDSLCGSFNEKAFRHSYSFLSHIRAEEKQQLKEELKTQTDSRRKDKLKYLLQRMENQGREERQQKKKLQRGREQRKAQIEMLQQGKKPRYPTKSEKRILDLVEQYEELKDSGKLQKHIMKHRKRNVQKARKKLKVVNDI